MKQALYALLSFVSLRYFFSDDVGLSVGVLFMEPPEARPAWSATWLRLVDQTAAWCSATIRTIGWDMGDTEAFGDEMADETLARAQSLANEEALRGVEAFYLSALVFVVEHFCTVWQTLGYTCHDTPLPALRSALTNCLMHDYSFDLAAPDPRWTAVLAAADDLAKRWRTWACQPHPLLMYDQ